MIQLNFQNGSPNSSLQVGDLVFYVGNPNTNVGGFTTADTNPAIVNEDPQSQLIYIGNVVSIDIGPNEVIDLNAGDFIIYVQNTSSVIPPSANDYILFAKNNNASSDLVGYYNKVVFRNDSPKKAELFAISCNYTESSK
jgi:hypothetical protein